MARQTRSRRRTRNDSNGESDTASDTASTTTTNERESGRKVAGLTPEQIQSLLGSARTKGQYVVRLNEFLDSGEGGVDVQAEWMEFRERKTSTLKQGFENARSNKEAAEGSDNVKVITNEDHVYLINLAIAGEEAEAA